MKFRILIFALSVLAMQLNAQTPQKITYQAVIRNSNNTLVLNTAIGMQVSILLGSSTGTVVYKETYATPPKTNANGLVTVEIGSGNPSVGSFSGIDWSAGAYFIKIETDPSGGSNYSITGTHQLLSVPYALYSNMASALSSNAVISPSQIGDGGALSNQVLVWNGNKWIPTTLNIFDGDSSVTNELQILAKSGNWVTLSKGGGGFSVADEDSSSSNEIQTLSKSGNQVKLSLNGGSFSVADADSNSSNEIQTLSKTGNLVKLSLNGGSFSVADEDSSSSNEIQTLSKNGNQVKLSLNGGSFSVADQDSSSTNEIQTLSLKNDSLLLSNGGVAKIPFNTYAWKTKGNAGLDSSAFIGTSDSVALRIRVYGKKSGLIDPGYGNSVFGYNSFNVPSTGIENAAMGSWALQANTSGSYNTALGSAALYNNKTGYSNVALGAYALFSDTSNGYNLAVGTSSMYYNRTGYYNTGIGNWTLYKNTTGIQNTVVGFAALYSNTSGAYNTALGDYAMYYNTSGKDNTALGYKSMESNTTGNYNIAIGSSSLAANKSGINNVAVGVFTLQNDTSGSSNIAIGRSAMAGTKNATSNIAIGETNLSSSSLTGTNNTAVGHSSMVNTTTGRDNTAVGYNTLYANTTGIANAAIGENALSINTTGSYNAALGYQSMNLNTTGQSNTALGAFALANNTTASYNTAIGNNAASALTTGTNVVAIGYQALKSNKANSRMTAVGVEALFNADNRTNGISTYNTAVGYQALYGSATPANNTGTDNVAFGDQSIFGFTTATGNAALGSQSLYATTTASANVALGYQALRNTTTCNSNVAVGYQAGYSAVTGSSNVFIGYQAGYNETNSNRLYISNSNTTTPLVYGNFSNKSLTINDSLATKFLKLTNGATNGYVLKSDASGNASWASPSSVITAGNGLSFSGSTLNSVWTSNSGNIYNNNSGYIGLGTSSPAYYVHVNSSINSALLVQSAASTGTWQSLYNTTTGGTVFDFISTGSSNSEGAGNLLIRGNSSVKMILKSANGYLGLGTTAPLYNLHVSSSSAAESNVTSSSNAAYISAASASGQENGVLFKTYSSSSTHYKRWLFGKSNTSESGSNAGSDFFINRYDDTGAFLSQPIRIVRSTGFVGINTSSPTSQLSVVASGAKTAGFTGMLVSNTATASSVSNAKYGLEIQSTGTWSGGGSVYGLYVSSVTGATNVYDAVFNGGGNVGIGMSTPNRKLVVTDATSGTDWVVDIRNTTNSSSSLNNGVLIRSGSDSYNSSFQSNIFTFVNPSNSTAFGGVIQSSSSSCSFVTSSDIRLKENIKPTHYGLDDLMKIEVRDYTFKRDSGKYQQTGFIAQQLYSVYPNPVVKGNDSTNWMVDYGQVTPLIVKAVQDQQSIIEKQKSELENQKQLIIELMRRLEALEKDKR